MSSILQKYILQKSIHPKFVYIPSRATVQNYFRFSTVRNKIPATSILSTCQENHFSTSTIDSKKSKYQTDAQIPRSVPKYDVKNQLNTSLPQSVKHTLTQQVEAQNSVIEQSIEKVAEWAKISSKHEFVSKLADDSKGVEFVMKFTDWVMRTESPRIAASFLTRLLDSMPSLPLFMSSFDRGLIWLGGRFAPIFPSIVVHSARIRMKTIVSPFVGDVDTINFNDGNAKNVNLLGEAVLGQKEAARRRSEAHELLKREGVDYVSVKVSGITSQLKKWDFNGSLKKVIISLYPLFLSASKSNPKVLINLDMEEYHDLELTVAAFKELLSQNEFKDLDAGIVLQAYLPDALPELQSLVKWANYERPGKGEVKIRLVKGANLAMEKVEAEINGWEQAPYLSKLETDANYLRCLDWLLTRDNLQRVRIGVASHNLFTLAFAYSLSKDRGVKDRIGFEHLNGMTPSHTSAISSEGHSMLLYAPVCHAADFDNSIAYLFRRFEESSSEGNFLRSLPTLSPNSTSFEVEEEKFKNAHKMREEVFTGRRRVQERPAHASNMTEMRLKTGGKGFINESDSDPVLPNVREWALDVLDENIFSPASSNSWVCDVEEMKNIVNKSKKSANDWNLGTTKKQRREILESVGDEISRRRGALINAMIYEGSKTFAEADLEISEAIDFANYYGMMAESLPKNFTNLGLVTVAAPWNFPAAIGAGGAFASLAAGNSVILKPSPNTPRCLELIAECAWKAGVPKDVLKFAQCPENDVGKYLITESDGVILTGSTETAEMFRSWKNDMRLFAETSGKNSMIITPAADIDLAVLDLVNSAFSNSGQKCSASSLAICVGGVYDSERFRRQLKDAVESIEVGPSNELSTGMGPIISKPNNKLLRALTILDEGEEWLVKPKCIDEQKEGRLWTPGVRLNVKARSWFHKTEFFGPVLGLMSAHTLDEALELQNSTQFGLTGGIQSLDSDEVKHWTEEVKVGNAYVNRGTTGAIVQRQCFGGWKASAVGRGAKAGGPNYVSQFGVIFDDVEKSERNSAWLNNAKRSDDLQWENTFSKEHDPSNLFCESNVFRYVPLEGIAIRIGPNANEIEVERVKSAIRKCGVPIISISMHREEDEKSFSERLSALNVERVRVIGDVEHCILQVAAKHNIHVETAPVIMDARYELLHYLKEQSVSRTLHRFGNLVTA